jgi:hypothetical protein
LELQPRFYCLISKGAAGFIVPAMEGKKGATSSSKK